MSKYNLKQDAHIICDADDVGGDLPEADDMRDFGEGLTRHEAGPRLGAVEFKANLRKARESESSRQPVYDRPTRPPRTQVKKPTDIERAKEGFTLWMFILYRIASAALIVVFLGGMFFGTRTLLSLGRVISKQIQATENVMAASVENGAPASSFVSFDDASGQQSQPTTADIKVGTVTIKFSANETIIVMVMEYAVGFVAMLLFMKFHKFEVEV